MPVLTDKNDFFPPTSFPGLQMLRFANLLHGWMYQHLLTSILLMGIYAVSHLSLSTNGVAMSNCIYIISQVQIPRNVVAESNGIRICNMVRYYL